MLRRRLVSYYKMQPASLAGLSFSDAITMYRAAEDAERRAWQKVATVCSFIRNDGGPRSKKFKRKGPAELFPGLFPLVRSARETFEDRNARAQKQLAEREAQRRRDGTWAGGKETPKTHVENTHNVNPD